MVVRYINSKLLELNHNYKNYYKNYYSRAIVLNNSTNADNEPCALTNRLLGILRMKMKSLTMLNQVGASPLFRTKKKTMLNQVNHMVATSGTMMVTPTSTTVSSTTLNTWPKRHALAALPLGVIMYKFRKISCVAMLAMCCMFLGNIRIEHSLFSDRRHFVFEKPNRSPKSILPQVSLDNLVDGVREDCELLPPTHHKTLRVASIACKLGQGMHEVLGLQSGFKMVAYEPGNKSSPVWTMGQRTQKETLFRLKDTLNHMVGLESSLYIDHRGHRAKDLEGLVWKVVVINSKNFNAYSGPYNTIFIHSNLIDRCSDEELAFIIGHEMGHAVGRHEEYVEMWNPLKSIIKEVVMLIAFLFSSEPCPTNHEEEIKLKQIINNLHRRRNEYDADHIGMMLMASAGYDPRGAPIYLSKNISLFQGGPFHSRGSKRVAYLKNPKRMKKAMSLYRDVKSFKLITNLVEN